jgi:hypothetical protein
MGAFGQPFRIGTSRPPTRAAQARLRLEDVPRPSLAQLVRRDKLDAKIRRGLGRSADGAGGSVGPEFEAFMAHGGAVLTDPFARIRFPARRRRAVLHLLPSQRMEYYAREFLLEGPSSA